MFFGYELKMLSDGNSFLLASPEKAIVDLLYLYPQYNTEQAMIDLRFDEDWMHEKLNKNKMLSMIEKIGSKALTNRVNLLIKTYEL